MRKNTKLEPWEVCFAFNDGGMGDYLNYAAATTWIARNCPHIVGKVFTPSYLVSVMNLIHLPYKNWDCLESEKFQAHMKKGSAFLCPSAKVNGIITAKQFLTVLGAHPIDVGFAYYAGSAPAPSDCILPVLDLEPIKNFTPKSYVCVLVGGTTKARTVTAKNINPIIDHIISEGLIPIFLGKSDLLGDGKKSTDFAEGINYHKGSDLRDKTSLREAAALMQHSVCSLGIDGGLLHLAALMKNSNIIFGYNITSIEHRKPRRNHGECIDLFPKDLECAGCQSQLKLIKNHAFSECLYSDYKCLDFLFKNDSIDWKEAITYFKKKGS